MDIDVVRNRSLKLATASLLFLVASAAPAASETARGDRLRQVPIEELKLAYRYCNREALAGHLDGAAAMGCSLVYEALKRRAFEGDFDRLLAWSRQQDPQPHSPASTSARRP